MPTKQIDIVFNQKSAGNGAKETVSALQSIEQQANRTREKMEKLANVGNKLAMTGGLIVAPFALAMKKYVDTAKETEPISRRLVALNKKWEESQVRLGRITAEIVLPALEKGAVILEKVIRFAEANPGVVQAALTIGGTLVILGGLISTTAQLVSTVATIQGLAASAGLAIGGGGAAAGAGAAGLGAALPGLISAGISLAVPILVGTLAVAIGANVGLGVGNALAGTNQTWDDIAETARMLLVIVKVAWLERIPQLIGQALQALGAFIGNAIKSIVASIGSWFRGGKASGGYMDRPGFYAGAETGAREFVMNGITTRNAERAIGGRLTQGAAASYMTNNVNLSNGQTVAQGRRQYRQNQKQIAGAVFSLMGA
jgi:hypothetical protein